MDPAPCDDDLHQQVLQTTLEQISSEKTGDSTAQCCVICLADVSEPCRAQPCGHSNFDFLCLVTWLEKRPTCPLCKNNVGEVQYELSEDCGQAKVYKVPECSEQETNPGQISGSQHSDDSDFGRRPSWLFDDDITWRRRSVYRNNLYSLHVGFNRRHVKKSRYRELLPQDFLNDSELVSRARTWLSRELRVFEFLYTSSRPTSDQAMSHRPRSTTAEYLLEYIIAILKSIDTQCSSGQAENLIQEFLGRDYTRLLLHELRAWLRSGCDSLAEWDHTVQYPGRNPSFQRSPNIPGPSQHQD